MSQIQKLYTLTKKSGDLLSITPQEEVLVIFDVDQVLIDPTDQVLSAKGDPLKSRLLKDFEYRLGAARANQLYSILVKTRAIQRVEETLPTLIATLIAHDIKVIALTAFPTGTFGCIANVENFREQQLKMEGFEFQQSFKGLERLLFHELRPEQDYRVPTFQSGILYTGTGGMGAPHLTKARVLQAFCKRIAWKPRKVIFFDDGLKHLEEMEAFCLEEKILFEGYHYLEALKLPGVVDKVLGRLQFKYLEKHHRWLSDEEARKQSPLLKGLI